MGLISLAPAGLLFCGEPEKAYRKAYELDFIDVGFAKDATAIMAAMISEALGGKKNAKEIVRLGLSLYPMGYGKNRPMVKSLRKFIRIADQATSDQDLIQRLAAEVKNMGVFDPRDTLGVAVAAFYFTDGDPVRTIVIAANDRDLDTNGNLKKLRDVDCSAGVAGALVGALRGIEAFPPDWVQDTIKANKKVYAIDLEDNAKRFCEVVYGRQTPPSAPQEHQ
jgi:ADP-ribosylglycohydrolase